MRYLAILFTIMLTGCSGLALRHDDNAMETTGKVVTRVVLAPVTLGLSELRMYELRLAEGCANQGLPYDRFQHACGSNYSQSYAYNPYAEMALIQGMNQGLQGMRVEQPRSSGYQIVPVPRSLSCQSFTSGQYINTNCY